MNVNFKSLSEGVRLANGNFIPAVGFGTWQATGNEAYNSVLCALKEGYRHIDTAAAYANEEEVGKAINDFIASGGAKREEIFVTTKLWNTDHGYDSAAAAIKTSLAKLKLDYVDLYLIHWPNPLSFRNCWAQKNAESWKAMEEAHEKGLLCSIGVSNFCERHLEPLLKIAKIKPVVNQIKLCPGQTQSALVSYCRKLNILLEAYSPFGTGKIFTSKEMSNFAEKYGRTIAQICLRWSLQEGFVPIAKSVTSERIKENARVFDFVISEGDCEKIAALKSDVNPPRNPDEAPF